MNDSVSSAPSAQMLTLDKEARRRCPASLPLLPAMHAAITPGAPCHDAWPSPFCGSR